MLFRETIVPQRLAGIWLIQLVKIRLFRPCSVNLTGRGSAPDRQRSRPPQGESGRPNLPLVTPITTRQNKKGSEPIQINATGTVS